MVCGQRTSTTAELPGLTIIWTAEAEVDRDRIWFFVGERNADRADRIEARLDERVMSLTGVPGQGRPAGRAHRVLSIPDIRLVVRYRIDEDAIRILRVWHAREHREEA